MRSRLVDRFSGATDRDGQRRDIAKFIAEDPDSAAQVAIGLSRDDAQGNNYYESSLLKNTRSRLSFNRVAAIVRSAVTRVCMPLRSTRAARSR